MNEKVLLLIGVAFLMFIVIGGLSMIAHYYTLNGIKSRTVGDGPHGVARFATSKETKEIYKHIHFDVENWRQGKNLPKEQGLVIGCTKDKSGKVTSPCRYWRCALPYDRSIRSWKTAFFLYPKLEYACATGMSFIATDTKGDLARNYGGIAKDNYGYRISVLDLRNSTRSDGTE